MAIALDSYLRDVNRYKVLTAEEQMKLAERIKKGDKNAEEEFINTNLRIPLKIAYKLINRHGGLVDIEDLVSSGNIGLIEAARRFDPAKGRFSTIAYYWVERMVKRALGQERRDLPFVIKANNYSVRAKLRQLNEEYYKEHSKYPSLEELTNMYNTNMGKGNRISVDKATRLLSFEYVKSKSLEENINGEDKALKDLIKDDQSEDPEERINIQQRNEVIYNAIEKLSSREAEVIKLRFGFYPNSYGEKMKRVEIGKRFGCSHEAIRLIEKVALQKLRSFLSENELC